MTDLSPSSCPWCRCQQATMVLSVLDEFNSQVFSLVRCQQCKLVRTTPLLDARELDKYYYAHYWHETAQQNILLKYYMQIRLNSALRLLRRCLKPDAKILDVGCGNGEMVGLMLNKGYDAYGIENSEATVQHAQAYLGQRIRHGDFETMPVENTYDAVTFYHVLEHLANPRHILEKAHQLLSEDGLLLIEVPNIQSLGFWLFRKRWYSLDIPRHLYHFSAETLGEMLTQNQFEVISTSFFSLRNSPASWVVSLFPQLNPIRLRQPNTPLLYKVAYLGLQLAVIPVVGGAAILKRGETLQIIARKKS